MANIKEIVEIKKYVDSFYNRTRYDLEYDDENINPVIIKSALIYQYLLLKYEGRKDSVKNIINSYGGEIGLIGPGNGKITCCLEALFSRFTFCHDHSIYHDAYGRFCKRYGHGSGYCYLLRKLPKILKKNPLFGNIIGLTFSFYRRLILSNI